MRAVPAIMMVLLTGLAGCGGPAAPSGPGFPDGPVAGVAFSPPAGSQDVDRFFAEAAQAGQVVAWSGTIDRIGDPQGGAVLTAQQAARNGLYLYVQTTPFRPHDGGGPGLAQRDRWTADLVDFVAAYDVPFLAIGIEVNLLHERDPDAYRELAGWYPFAYASIKQASPDTLVFPTFQYERIQGLHGGLWGGDADAPDQWSDLNDFAPSDLIAFTTYPGLVFADPDDLPDDYYDFRDRALGAKAFTEVGWSAARDIEGWRSDVAEQAAFVDRFFDIAPRSQLTIWPYLYDQGIGPPFDTMGLREPDGSERPAHGRWVARTAPDA